MIIFVLKTSNGEIIFFFDLSTATEKTKIRKGVSYMRQIRVWYKRKSAKKFKDTDFVAFMPWMQLGLEEIAQGLCSGWKGCRSLNQCTVARG